MSHSSRERVRDLADRYADSEGFAQGRQQVLGPRGDAAHLNQRPLRFLGVPLGAHSRCHLELAASGLRVDPQQLDLLRFGLRRYSGASA